jgi:peptide/nickel transport system substrate-binding protein
VRPFLICTLIAASIGLAPGAALAQKRTLVVATSQSDAGKLDPHLAAAGADKGILNWMFNALVRIRPGEANPEFIEPDLAESWQASEDGLEWTFKLRRGVACHHGFGEFTAADAAYSLLRAANKTTSAFAGDFAALESATAVDPVTLKLTLKQPVPSLLGLVSNYHGGLMVCKAAAEQAGDGFARRPIGTGPFMFADYQPQQFVRMVANPAYFRGAPQIGEIVYRYIPSDATRDLAFRNGEIDMVFGRQTDQWVTRTRALPGVKVVAMEPAELNMLHLNVTAKPLDDIRVRQAVAHAIDRKAMVQFSGPEATREAVSVIPNGNLGTNPNAPLAPYDLAKAKALLAEAGYPDGVTIKSIASTLPVLARLSEALQAQLRKAGITLDLQPVDHATYHAEIRKDHSSATLYQAARFPVADVYLTQFFHSRSTVGTPTGVINLSHCAVADQEIGAARAERNVERQKAMWMVAQDKIAREVCAVPFSESLVIWAWRDSLDLGYEMKGSLNLMPQVTEKAHFTR